MTRAVTSVWIIGSYNSKQEPWYPLTHPRLANVTSPDEFFAEVARGDILVHQPYHAFGTSFEAFVSSAAADADSLALKTTVYRTSGDSPLVPALIEAAEMGKQAVCLVELKARFDERRNIGWARALEQAGVHVVYGFPNLKIHAKTTLVVRREDGELRRYAHVGTGNYHAATARSYEDFGLFTADPDITADVADLFNFLTGFSRPRRFRKLLVAPFDLRERLVDEVHLRRLDVSGTAALISNQLVADRISDELVTTVHEKAEGNPFFTEELLKALVEQGAVYEIRGHWERKELSEIEVPHSVRSVVGQRVSVLPLGAQDLLRLASVLGPECDLDVLLIASGLAESELLDQLDAALGAGLLEERRGGKPER